MCVKYVFYSLAYIAAVSRAMPSVIMLGKDQLYWVVDRSDEDKYVQEGCVFISYAT